ncbi:unnamed protein product [Symbiodinium sp. CCMP2592]|nr:unnamed protein product [Symbiodinium sp. CCMP2592]
MVEDIFSSRACQKLDHQLLFECMKHDELTYLSVDGTVKCTMPLLGQKRPGGKNRQSEPFFINATDAIHTVVTVRGRSGAVVGFWPLLSEKAEHLQEAFLHNLPQAALAQVQCVATDAPSSLMFSRLRSIMPNLQCLCLDPVHLAIKYEYATGRGRTKGSASLRACLGKFNSTDSTVTANRWGAFFTGQRATPLSARERTLRDQILSGGMSASKASSILQQAEAKALAAISKIFRNEVERKGEKKGKFVFQHLAYAAEAERLEWLLNNLRFRSTQPSAVLSLLSSGATSNEALHAEMRSWLRQIQSMHQSSLLLKCSVFRLRKLLEDNTALHRPTARQMTPGHVLARRLGQNLWSTRAWQQFAKEKAQHLPLKRLRDQHTAARRKLILQRAGIIRRLTGKQPQPLLADRRCRVKKRTAFTLLRTAGIIRQGVAKRRAPS